MVPSAHVEFHAQPPQSPLAGCPARAAVRRRKLSSADPVVTAAIKGLAAGTANVGLALWLGAKLPPAGVVGGAAAVGFLGVGVSLVLFPRACEKVKF